jgi:Flp pilus assembly protein TadG
MVSMQNTNSDLPGSRGLPPRQCDSVFKKQRRGVAAVEFALVAPLMFLVVLAIMEFGRAMMVGEILNTAARSGCRAGTVAGSANNSVTTVIGQCLPSVSGSTTTIQVNGKSVDVSTAARGDTISISITVPFSRVSWLPPTFLGNVTLSANAVMYHE